jgi:hypothetical protein
MKEDGSKDYLYRTRNNVYIYHNTPNIYFGSYEEAYNFLYHNILNIPDFKTTRLGVEEMSDKTTINMTIIDTDKSTLNKMCYKSKSVAETITFPSFKKNTIQMIDKKDIPVTIAEDPFDDIGTKRDILTNIIKPFILEPGEEWHNTVDDMTDEQVNDFIDMLAKIFVKMKSFKKEELQDITSTLLTGDDNNGNGDKS